MSLKAVVFFLFRRRWGGRRFFFTLLLKVKWKVCERGWGENWGVKVKTLTA